jgi:heptaprenyl diphosphate synthase/octaprenyl-diphosphate synthase
VTTTTSLFAPVHDDLIRVDRMIMDLDRVGLPGLEQMLEHVLGAPGKRVRPALTLLAGAFHRYDLELLLPMAAAVEVLHTATLVHDDTVDRAETRRGHATLNSIWNGGLAVLAGDYLFANSADMVASTGNVRVMRLFAQTLMTLTMGELGQIFAAFDADQSREDYYGRIARKTAALFSMATESGAVLSGAPEPHIQALRQYGWDLGVAFQIVDDIFDFTASSEEIGKPVGGDLRSGTLTLPALLINERYPERNMIRRYFEDKDEALLQEIVQLSRTPEIVAAAYGVAREFGDKAINAIRNLPEGEPKRCLVELTDYVLSRRN